MIDVGDEMIQDVIDLWENVGGPALPPPPPPKDWVLPSSKYPPYSSLLVPRRSNGHPLRPQHSAPLLRVEPRRLGTPPLRQAEFGHALPGHKAFKMLGIDFPSAEDSFSRSPTSLSSSSSGNWSSSSITSCSSSYDPTLDAAALHESFRLLHSKRPSPALLNKTIAALSRRPEAIPLVKHRFKTLYSHDLSAVLRTSTTGNHRLLLMRLLAGPSRYEVEWLTAYCSRPNLPADDKIVAETLFGKTPAELERIKAAFSALNGGRELRDALAKLYGPASAFGRAAVRMLSGCRGGGTGGGGEVLPGFEREAAILAHVEDLYRSADRSGNKYLDQGLLVELVLRRSDAYLRGLCKRFAERHARELVDVVAARERVLVGSAGVLPNNLAYALIHALTSAISKPYRDAKLINDTLGILGTQDARLIARTLRLHFDRPHLENVRLAYKERYGREMVDRIKGEVRKGGYRDLLVMLLGGGA